MIPSISPNTTAILLLTAPLIAGRNTSPPGLLSPAEYKKLISHLREIQIQPADLLSPDATKLLRTCHFINEARLRQLLGRGFLLSQVIERWQTRAIWVVSHTDEDYPKRLKMRLQEDAPAVLYGCGDGALLQTGGLAVVGSRHVDDTLIEYTMDIGHRSAKAGTTLISGGAKGIDQAAMRGTIESDGRAVGVMSHDLERTAMNREHRNQLLDGKLVLISPYDPNAGFNVGNAMQRNKIIYALADAALVVHSDLNQGGTWSGAVEQLDKLRLIPVYVRSTGTPSKGLNALRQKGARAWPTPQDSDDFAAVVHVETPNSPDAPVQTAISFPGHGVVATESMPTNILTETVRKDIPLQLPKQPLKPSPMQADALSETSPARNPSEILFATVREVVQQMLDTPRKDAEVAAILQISSPQAKHWLKRLVDEGILEKQKKPARYAVKQSSFSSND